MPNISAKVIADSISPEGERLTTLQISFPKFILAEFNTHRVFSRNFSSTRAIPTSKLIDMIRKDPYIPIQWGSNQKGMQAGEPMAPELHGHLEAAWLDAANKAADAAEKLFDLGLHKQWAGRVIEPFMMVNGVVTATEWENFFALRAHKDAQPEIHALALQMFNAMAGSQPKHLEPGEWHLPYITEADYREAVWDNDPEDILVKVSAARCARVSYLTHDGRQTTVEEDLALFQKLLIDTPLHASPAEHQATPDTWIEPNHIDPFGHYEQPARHGNLKGWIQHRKMLPNEYVPG